MKKDHILQAFRTGQLSYTEILQILKSFDNAFTPAFSTNINSLEVYALKLAQHAEFILYQNNLGEIIGILAYYRNNIEREIYIPYICVNPHFQKQGIGILLIENVLSLINQDFTHITLEVKRTNTQAINFYRKVGFSTKEVRKNSLLLDYSPF